MFSASGSSLTASCRRAVFPSGSVRQACIPCALGPLEVTGQSNSFALWVTKGDDASFSSLIGLVKYWFKASTII